MRKRFLYGLILIALMVIVLILNTGGSASVSFKLFKVSASPAVIYFTFLGIGVTIGCLLR